MILHGYGRLSWPDARRLLDGCACTWTDLDGIHLTDTPPTELPDGATHLWGWDAGATDRWLRVRFDHTSVYVAALSNAEDSHAVLREPADPTFRTAATWHDKRAGPLPPEITNGTWQLAEVSGPHPVTFVRTALSR